MMLALLVSIPVYFKSTTCELQDESDASSRCSGLASELVNEAPLGKPDALTWGHDNKHQSTLHQSHDLPGAQEAIREKPPKSFIMLSNTDTSPKLGCMKVLNFCKQKKEDCNQKVQPEHIWDQRLM